MNYPLAVKAAELRANYINDVIYYGINCNTCDYNYSYYAIQDFLTDCFTDVCVDIPELETTLDVINCTPVFNYEVESIDCVPAVKILDCNQQYITQDTQALESNVFLYNDIVNLENSIRFTFSEVVVNGVNYLNMDKSVDITPDNVQVENVGSLIYVTNLVDYLNSLNLPQMEFRAGLTQRTMRITYPVGQTWQITTKANNDLDNLVAGVKINQDGFVSIQTSVGGSYLTYASISASSYANNFNPNVDTLETGYLC